MKWVNGAFEVLIDWTGSDEIVIEGENLLSVVMDGSHFQFFINGTKVNEITDSSFSESSIGVYVGGLNEIAFDDLTITPPGLPLLKRAAGTWETLV